MLEQILNFCLGAMMVGMAVTLWGTMIAFFVMIYKLLKD